MSMLVNRKIVNQCSESDYGVITFPCGDRIIKTEHTSIINSSDIEVFKNIFSIQALIVSVSHNYAAFYECASGPWVIACISIPGNIVYFRGFHKLSTLTPTRNKFGKGDVLLYVN